MLRSYKDAGFSPLGKRHPTSGQEKIQIFESLIPRKFTLLVSDDLLGAKNSID